MKIAYLNFSRHFSKSERDQLESGPYEIEYREVLLPLDSPAAEDAEDPERAKEALRMAIEYMQRYVCMSNADKFFLVFPDGFDPDPEIVTRIRRLLRLDANNSPVKRRSRVVGSSHLRSVE